MTNKKIFIQISDEDSEFLSDLLARDDIDIVSDVTDTSTDFMLIAHKEYMALHQMINDLYEEKTKIIYELKSPLALIKGYADVILSGMTGEISEQQEQFLEIVKSSTSNMQALINDMSDSTRLGTFMSIDKSPFQILPMINETLRSFKKMLDEKQQTITTSIPDDLPSGLGDETRVIQILTHLISNAHKYSNEGDTIEIKINVTEDFIQFSVIDSGSGIKKEDLDKIFTEKYFRPENVQNQTGKGFGFLLSKNLVTAMGGQIWVASKLGKGSTFCFTIPKSTL